MTTASIPPSGSLSRIHKTTGEADHRGLADCLFGCPADEIVDDLRNHDPIIRAAALMGGGGRLPPDKLPVLLEFIHSKDRNLERSAIFAMRNFGEEGRDRDPGRSGQKERKAPLHRSRRKPGHLSVRRRFGSAVGPA